MDLIRLDSNPHPKPDEYPDDHRQSEFLIEKVEEYFPEGSTLRVPFHSFGRGEHRRSSFAVEMSWIDVKGFVRAFIEMRHPEALHLQRIIQLVEEMENAGWMPSDPPDEDFWDILPRTST